MKDFGVGVNCNYTVFVGGKIYVIKFTFRCKHFDFSYLSVGYEGYLIKVIETDVEETAEDVAVWKLTRLDIYLCIIGIVNRNDGIVAQELLVCDVG